MTVYPNVGDEVVVTVKGKVSYVARDGHGTFEVGKTSAGGVLPTLVAPEHSSVTVEILKPPVKVGDVVTAEGMKPLPVGSLIEDVGRNHYLKTRKRGWVWAGDGGPLIPPTSTVVYLPDAAW